MSRFCRAVRCGQAALAMVAAATAGRSADVGGAQIQGDISGGVKIDALPDLGLVWRVTAGADGLVLSTKRAGVDIEVELRSGEAGVWSWRILKAQLDVAELWPLLRGKLGATAAGWSASGSVVLEGRGTWSPQAGPAGEARLTLREGWARSDALDMEVSGAELDIGTDALAAGALPPGQALRVAKISAAGMELKALKAAFGVDSARVLEVASVDANFLGGGVKLRPFRIPLDKPVIDAAADVDALRLDEAAQLMPWLVESAQGVLRGRVELGWSEAGGLRVRDGGLKIVESDDAVFRLTPSPGLLTKGVPKRLSLLPWKWARWISINDPAYDPLREIELGRVGLRLETFQVEFWPDGPGQGRTATIHIVGKPTSGEWVKAVKMDVNFHGPWSEFLAFGLNNELSGISFRFE